MGNIVYVGTSIDNYVADRNGGLEWLESVPNPGKSDFGWDDFLSTIDAVVMGRKTFETVIGFNIPWPYPVPAFILSSTMKSLPEGFEGDAVIISGIPEEIDSKIREKGYENIYIDGGSTIQKYLKSDLIDDLIITKIPILLGGGISLFSDLPDHIMFEHLSTEVMIDQLVKSHYRRNH